MSRRGSNAPVAPATHANIEWDDWQLSVRMSRWDWRLKPLKERYPAVSAVVWNAVAEEMSSLCDDIDKERKRAKMAQKKGQK